MAKQKKGKPKTSKDSRGQEKPVPKPKPKPATKPKPTPKQKPAFAESVLESAESESSTHEESALDTVDMGWIELSVRLGNPFNFTLRSHRDSNADAQTSGGFVEDRVSCGEATKQFLYEALDAIRAAYCNGRAPFCVNGHRIIHPRPCD